MIRRALIPAIATCGALAVGIALGTGPLENATSAQTTPAAKPDLAARQAAAFGRRWADQAATPLLSGRLSGRRVAVVTLPGADPTVVSGLVHDIALAKGTVSAKVATTATMLDPDQQAMLGSLGERFAEQSHGAIATDLPAYSRIGALLGLAVAGPGQTTTEVTVRHTRHRVRRIVRHVSSPVSRTTAQETLRAGRLATVSGGGEPSGLVLVVLGDHQVDASALHDLLAGLATEVAGIVVAGDESAAARGGTLATLRAEKKADKGDDKLLTVDGVETPYGRIAAALGLARQITAQGGDFGASGIDGLLP